MSDPFVPPAALPVLLDRLTDLLIDVLNAAARDGWSPGGAEDALHAVDLLIAALRQHGGPLHAALGPVPGCTVAGRAALCDPLPPPPRRGTYGAQREEENGTARFRVWRDARWHDRSPETAAREATEAQAAYDRAVATEKLAKKRAREAAKETLRALDALKARGCSGAARQ